MIGELDIALKLLVAVVLGGIIGYERQIRNKSAGLRTHILVCIGSCLIMILSINIYYSVQGMTNADPTRLAAQVVSGIGFLGAGSIMREGLTIKGLTTAASLWVVSGVGLAVGSGYYLGACLTTGLVFITLYLVGRLEKKDCAEHLVGLVIKSINSPGQIGKIGAVLGGHGVSIRDIKIEEQGKNLDLSLMLYFPTNVSINEVTAVLSEIQGILSVRREL